MAELKTKKQHSGVQAFLAGIPDEDVRKDCETLAALMSDITGDPGDMWGASIAGFGTIRLKYKSGRELDWFPIGFSPRKQNLTIYMMDGHEDKQDLLPKLGKYSLGKGCLYMKRLSDVDLNVLEEMLRRAAAKDYAEA